MKDKHTPGPWIVAEDQVGDDDGNVIADVTQFNQWNTTEGIVTKEMPWEANARLMAAAPELLEAIKESMWYIDLEDSGANEWYLKTEELIAKIEGDE